METPKHSAAELRAMLKEHKASMPRLSAKKSQLMEYAGKVGLFKPIEPAPVEAAPVAVQKKKSSTTVVAPVASVVKSELPKELKKEAKKVKIAEPKTPKPEAAPAKKSFSEGAKNALAAYTSFLAEKKSRGMSHKEAQAAWKNRK
jgi:hypothetical protein